MDVLRPSLIYIGNRVYRRNPLLDQQHQQDVHYEDDVMDPIDDGVYDDEVCDAFTDIEETDNGYRLKLTIPSAYFKFIIGKKSETKKQLENETRTQVHIPKAGQQGDIVILGRDRRGVLSAKTRIELITEKARQRQPFTHFLSIPIISPAIRNSFTDFRNDVLRDCDGEQGLDESIFQNPDKLHLTLGTVSLMSDSEVERTTQVLEECLRDIIKPILGNQPLVANVCELEYMNDDPNAVDVLYAKVTPEDGSDRLQMVVDRVVDRFVSAGLMSREYNHVKLHVTIMNTLMRKDPTGTSEPQRDRHGRIINNSERQSFDACRILELFSEYTFGKQHIATIQLSKRYTTGQDGYYGNAGSISLP